MPSDESALQQAERHVRESEERVARQHRIVEKLINDGHDAEGAIQVLDLYKRALELQRTYLLILQQGQGL